MAKKGGQASLQLDITNDEEWDLLMERAGLVVVDVYTDWCGPCVGMMSNLKKVKLEIGSDYLHLAMANADKILKLERFRGRSEPTWLFLGSGQLLKVVYGTNAPMLMKEIADELAKEVQAIDGKRERQAYPFDQLTPEEKLKQDEMEAKRAIEAAKVRAEQEARKDKVKRIYLGRIARKFFNLSIVVFFPNVVKPPEEENGRKTSPAAYKLMSIYDTVGLSIIDQLELQLKEPEIHELFYNSDFKPPKKIFDLMVKEEVIVALVQNIVPLKAPPPEGLKGLTSRRGSLIPPVSSYLDVVEENLCLVVYGPGKSPYMASPDSVFKTFETVEPDDEVLPPCWTPRDHISKCAAARVIFPARIADLNVKEIPVPPPSFIMAFEADRAQEVLDVSKPFSNEVVHLGYFDSTTAAEAKKVCNTVYELEEMSDMIIDSAKVIIALSQEKSEPALILTQLGPVYVSPDVKDAEEEVDLFFPTSLEEEEIIDPWGPPPRPPPPIWLDEHNNEYIEVYLPEYDNRRVRKLFRMADGTETHEVVILEIPLKEVLQIEARERDEFEELRKQRKLERKLRKMPVIVEVEEELGEGEEEELGEEEEMKE